MNKRTLGTEYEKKACTYLQEQKYEILECNYRCRMGEIDIIARDGKYLVFLEVKYRGKGTCGYAASAVTKKKQQVISHVAAFYLLKNRLSDSTPCRFDVVAIDGDQITLYKNAFDYQY